MEGAQYPVLPLSIHDAFSALVASARSSVPGGSAYPRGNAFLAKMVEQLSTSPFLLYEARIMLS